MNSTADLFGVLAINKPQGMTSRDVVNRIQKLIRPTKIGHTGTLDPLATGVLLLAIGKATRLVEYAHLQPKSYEADFFLGHTSDTLDVDGETRALADAPAIDQSAWVAELEHWRGRIRQTPPQYSACKVQGRPAYELARKGVEVELTSREVTIYQLELLLFCYPQVSMSIRCSSGTYIRSLGNDIAASLGSGAVMSRLVRTAIGPYAVVENRLEQHSTIQCVALEQLNNPADVRHAMSSPVGLVSQFPQIDVAADECERLRTGSTLDLTAKRADAIEIWRGLLQGWDGTQPIQPPVVALNAEGQLVAILEVRQDRLQPTRVFL